MLSIPAMPRSRFGVHTIRVPGTTMDWSGYHPEKRTPEQQERFRRLIQDMVRAKEEQGQAFDIGAFLHELHYEARVV